MAQSENSKITRRSPSRAAEAAAGLSNGINRAKNTPNKNISQQQIRDHQSNLQNIEIQKKASKKNLSGIMFWGLLVLSIIEDFFDTILTLTGLGAIIFGLTTTLLAILVNAYLLYSGVKPTSKKIAWATVSWIADIFGIPTNALYLFAMRIIEHKNIEKSSILDKAAAAKALTKR